MTAKHGPSGIIRVKPKRPSPQVNSGFPKRLSENADNSKQAAASSLPLNLINNRLLSVSTNDVMIIPLFLQVTTPSNIDNLSVCLSLSLPRADLILKLPQGLGVGKGFFSAGPHSTWFIMSRSDHFFLLTRPAIFLCPASGDSLLNRKSQ